MIPNVLKITSSSKEKTFVDEVRGIYKAAKTQDVNDAGTEVTYTDAADELNVKNNVGYKVKLTSDGKIIYIYMYVIRDIS